MNEALKELLPRKVRLVLYVIVGLTLLVFAALEASDGNWVLFAVTLAGSLQSVVAVSNLTPEEYEPKHSLGEFDG